MTWLYVPSTSSHCALASEASNSESASLNLEAVSSVRWRGKQQPLQAWSRRWKQGGFIRLLSGLTLPPSTLDRGVALFIASLRATPASPTALQENGAEPMMIDSLSIRSCGSSMKRGLIVSSAKTSRGTLTDSLPHLSRHWKDWATALRLEYSARSKSVPATGANDCSSWQTEMPNWPTPMAGSPGTENYNAAGNSDFSRKVMEITEQWMTPNVPNGGRSISHAKITGRTATRQDGSKVQIGLEHQVKTWPTPATRDYHSQGASHNPAAQSSSLATIVEKVNWPTPATRDHKGVNSIDHVTTNGSGRMHMDQLPNFVEYAFRPFATELLLLPDRPTPSGLKSAETRRSLNPLFVEWLMGWPEGLSGFERSATVYAHWLLLMRGELSRLCLPTPSEQGDLF